MFLGNRYHKKTNWPYWDDMPKADVGDSGGPVFLIFDEDKSLGKPGYVHAIGIVINNGLFHWRNSNGLNGFTGFQREKVRVMTSALRKSMVGVGVVAVVVVATVVSLRHGSGEADSYESYSGPTTVSMVGQDVRILVADPAGYSTTLGVEGTGWSAEIRTGEPADWYQPIRPPGTKVVKDGNRYGVRVKAGVAKHVKTKPMEVTFWQGNYVSGGGSALGLRETYGMSPACVGAGPHQMAPGLDIPRQYTPPPDAVCPSPKAVGCPVADALGISRATPTTATPMSTRPATTEPGARSPALAMIFRPVDL